MGSIVWRLMAPCMVITVMGAWGCGGEADVPLTCDELLRDVPPPKSLDDVRSPLALVRDRFYPELAPAQVELIEDPLGGGSYFEANLRFETIEEPPLERSYLIHVNPDLFNDPPPGLAVGSVLVHEMKHIKDQTEMDSQELAAFGLWYAIGDVAEYERATDEYALEQGCANGLKAYWDWLYPRLSEEDAAQKRMNYYTSEEIDQWVLEHAQGAP